MPGLRREELAQLAGVSVDYYVRLEQGRAANPSDAVIDAIARALRLDEPECGHLHDLARPTRQGRRPRRRPERIRPELKRLLDVVEGAPAYMLGRRMDVLAWNDLAAALLTDFAARSPGGRNMVRLAFLDPDIRALYLDWERVARDSVGYLRLAAGRYPDDPDLAALVGELSLKSEEFRRWWAAHDVRQKSRGRKRFNHPVVGELTLDYETLTLPTEPDQSLVAFTAKPGSPSETSLKLLAAWAASAA